MAGQPADADRDRGEEGGRDGHDREPGDDGGLRAAEGGEDLVDRLLEDVRVVEERAEHGERDVGQDGDRDEQGGGQFPVHQLSLYRLVAIQATSRLSGWSTRCSRTRASTRSASPARCAAAMATVWRARLVVAAVAARSSRPGAAGSMRAAATRRVGSSSLPARARMPVAAAASPPMYCRISRSVSARV